MPRVRAEALHEQALLLAADDPGAALRHCHEALALAVEHDLRAPWPDALDTIAALADAEQAARLLAAADAARAALRLPRDPTAERDRDALAARLEAVLGAEAFAAASAQAGAFGPAEAVAYARRARGSRARPLDGWGSLTPTEREVVRLAVEGLHQPGDRRAPVHEPQHRQDAPVARLREARRRQPHRAGDARRRGRRPLADGVRPQVVERAVERELERPQGAGGARQQQAALDRRQQLGGDRVGLGRVADEPG